MARDWSEATSFEKYVLALIAERKKRPEEWKLILSVWGRERLKQIWVKYNVKGDQDGRSGSVSGDEESREPGSDG